MTKPQEETYYYFDPKTSTVYHSDYRRPEDPKLAFLGGSVNPNKKMTVAMFTKQFDRPDGYTIKPYPDTTD